MLFSRIHRRGGGILENKKHRSLYQICMEVSDRGELDLPTHKCSEYFLDMAGAVGFDVNLLKSGKSKNSSMKIHEDDVAFVIYIIKQYGCQDYLNLRRGKYDDVPMNIREMLLFGFCDMLRRSGASPDVIIATWRKLRLTMHMDIQPIVERFDEQTRILANLKSELLDDVSIAYQDRDVLLSHYSSQIANLIADLKHIKNLYCSIRKKEMNDIIQLETQEDDPDIRDSIRGIW